MIIENDKTKLNVGIKVKRFFRVNLTRTIFFLIGAIPITILFFSGIIELVIPFMAKDNLIRVILENELTTSLRDTIDSLLKPEPGFFNIVFFKFPYFLIFFPMMILAVFLCGDFDECPDSFNLFIMLIGYVIALIIVWCISIILEKVFNYVFKKFKAFLKTEFINRFHNS